MIVGQQCIHIPQKTRLIVFVIATLIAFITLIINAFWMQPLYKEGVNIIHSAQTHLNFKWLHIINNIFSMICHPSTVSVIIMGQLILAKHKLKAFIHVGFFLICIYIIAFLKQAYQQSRPIWSSNLIHKWEWFCPTDFGNPSGHSFALFPLYQPIIAKYVGGFERFKPGWPILIVIGFLLPFSRTYLGVHSWNQIMFGLTLGVAATVMYRYSLREWFYKLFAIIYKQKKLKHLVIIIMIHIFSFILPFVFFQIYSQNRPIQTKDIQNLNQFCRKGLTSYLIQQSMLTKCTMESFIFGIMYGLFLLKYEQKNTKYFIGQWRYPTWCSAVIHLVCFVLICVIFGGTFNVGLTKITKITFLNYISHTIGVILIGFGIVYILPIIQRKLNLISYQPQSSYTQLKQIESKQ